jgi:formylglycine-generating enzyme required for sulfatase activity
MNQLNIDYNFKNNYDYKEDIYSYIEMIDIKGGEYIQGVDNNTNYFYFDNESPGFQVKVDSFSVSKYQITNGQFLKFIKDNGYDNKDLFSPEGFRYIQDNNKKMPSSWIFKDNQFYEKVFGKIIKLRYNHPVNVTWYEANAFCKLYNYRMLKEKEWEYMAENNDNSICDYNFPQSVLKEKNENMGVYGLYGNYWEWCEDLIYPYDGFVIDPVYREMSYPFFGYKKICRGGAWCVPKFLATKTYRNAQMPDCDYQFISFRVCN